MATMYYLFLRILFTALCSIGDTRDCTLSFSNPQSPPMAKKSPDKVLLQQELAVAVSPSIKVLSDTVLGTFAKTKVPGKRFEILQIATAELGVREATGRNDGERVETYLRYTGLGKGHAWCAAFVSWCYGQTGLPQPRNPWSPALFPKQKTYGIKGKLADMQIRKGTLQADIFGIYGQQVRRINHVGLVRDVQGKYLITVEGNSHNRVESRRRHHSTIYAMADWIGGKP